MPEVHRLGRRGQAHIDDLTLGIMVMSPDPDDPFARMNIIDRSVRHGETVVVRPGQRVSVGAHVVLFTEVVPGSSDGYVMFTVERAQDASEGTA